MNTYHESLLIKEGYLASTSIGYGLTSLRKAGVHKKGEYYQSFFQLSIGIERMMKLIIIQNHRGKCNSFPDNKTMKSFSHNLMGLYNSVIEFAINEDILIVDDLSIEILKFLSEFAISDRYYNLDYLTGRKSSIDPLIQWSNIQDKLEKRYLINNQRVNKQQDILLNILNEKSYTIIYNEKNELINNAKEFMQESIKDEKIQGYAVYHILEVIRVLATILEDLEYEHNLYPCLREFFEYFNYDYTMKEVIRKKKWVLS
ncbi:hypothetical protein [Paenibacillus sp. M-152]|uniref:hypothetical protein n=1 Tax=Paenibacillus sp. M-152 TaxID=2487928 RepID=UPI000F6D0F2D|nr:hypothetical protein [Paenibacillus sp. M-152]AZH30497.1 hypothetical protein EGM68_17840 [Paenibacillus sp. M-152]